MVAVGVPVGRCQDVEGLLGKVLGCGHGVEDDGFVIRQTCQKVAYRLVAAIHQESVIPGIHQFFPGDALDIGEVHHHALFG